MCQNPKTVEEASDQKSKSILNPNAKAFNIISYQEPNLFHNQPHLLLRPPQAAAPVVFPAYYYHPVCSYKVQFQPPNAFKIPTKPLPENISVYRVSGGCGRFSSSGGGMSVKSVVGGLTRGLPTRLRKVSSVRPFSGCGERSFVQCWIPKKDAKSGNGGGRWSPPQSEPLPPSPASSDSSSPNSLDVSTCAFTTIMVKNIPNQLRRNNLMAFLDNHCNEENQIPNSESDIAYDFLYLPMDFGSGDNLGYAFVNFVNAEGAKRMREILNQFRWGVLTTTTGFVFESKKVCEITWAKIQGKEKLINHFKNSRFACRNLDYLPVVFSPPRDGCTYFAVPITVGNCLAFAR